MELSTAGAACRDGINANKHKNNPILVNWRTRPDTTEPTNPITDSIQFLHLRGILLLMYVKKKHPFE